MMSCNTVKCNVCKNRTGEKGEWHMSCKAYPDGIPLEIFSGLSDPSYEHCNGTEFGYIPPYADEE